MAEPDAQANGNQDEFEGGELLVCGATDWALVGRSKDVRPQYPNLDVPHRLSSLQVCADGAICARAI